MKLLKESTPVRHSFIIFFILFFLIGLLTIFYWFEVLSDPKWLAIISGLLAGFVVALFQTALSLRELQELDTYHALKIKEILLRRNDRNYYAKLISESKNKIWLQGVTAQRFLHHFANKEDSQQGAKVLLEAIGRGVEIRILVASIDCLLRDDDKKKAEMAEPLLNKLTDESNGRFKYAYYKHVPTHSIVTVDSQCIIGPIFPGEPSEHTPAIHLENSSEFVAPYLKYFRNEWKEWSKDKEVLQD
jgi:hypothetical protein